MLAQLLSKLLVFDARDYVLDKHLTSFATMCHLGFSPLGM